MKYTIIEIRRTHIMKDLFSERFVDMFWAYQVFLKDKDGNTESVYADNIDFDYPSLFLGDIARRLKNKLRKKNKDPDFSVWVGKEVTIEL